MTTIDNVEVNFKNEKYFVPNWIVESYKKYNIDLNDDLFNEIIKYKNPYSNPIDSSEIYHLLICYLSNKIVYSYDKGLGKIICYKENCKVVYNNLNEAIFDNYEKKYLYGFEKLDEKGIVPGKIQTELFKAILTVTNQHPYLELTNSFVSDIYSWKNGKKAINSYNDSYFKKKIGNVSFEDFKIQKVRHLAFCLGDNLMFLKNKINKSEQVNNRTDEEYLNNLNNLLIRYSNHNNTVFEKVSDLRDYECYAGIYILCFDKEKTIYVGQTTKSFKDRILQHFNKPKTDFDKSHKPWDVSRIYILHTTDEFVDWVECDCIATISHEYLCNSLAGGNVLDFIHDKNYDPSNYKLNDKMIKMIVNDISNAKKINSELYKLNKIK